ncbi:MAG: hypothetical protein ACREVQ_14025 [Burkholderiales bacterium]
MNCRSGFALVIALIWIVIAASGCDSQQSDNSMPLNVADFVDHTEKYKGLTLSLPLTISEGIHGRDGDSLKNYLGRVVAFHGFFGQSQNRFNLKVQIPENLEVPNAVYLDTVTVVFVCEEGDLQKGNVAKSISR